MTSLITISFGFIRTDNLYILVKNMAPEKYKRNLLDILPLPQRLYHIISISLFIKHSWQAKCLNIRQSKRFSAWFHWLLPYPMVSFIKNTVRKYYYLKRTCLFCLSSVDTSIFQTNRSLKEGWGFQQGQNHRFAYDTDQHLKSTVRVYSDILSLIKLFF